MSADGSSTDDDSEEEEESEEDENIGASQLQGIAYTSGNGLPLVGKTRN